MNKITFSSCFYIIKSKFDPSTYVMWMNNFISIVNHFNLVIYTDENSCKYIDIQGKPNIKVIIKPLTDFYNYRFQNYWIKNHEKNVLINNMSSWQLNMLWSEKICFVKETIDKKYFETNFYGWCDIGYFRNKSGDLHTNNLSNWSHPSVISNLNPSKIYYANVNNSDEYISRLYKNINNKNEKGLPINPIPPSQVSVAGGFFVLHKNKIQWWYETFNKKLELYFKNDYLVKDDQIIIIDCILTDKFNNSQTLNQSNFILLNENFVKFDNWFMFQRFLNPQMI
jgi:hypothetical protein